MSDLDDTPGVLPTSVDRHQRLAQKRATRLMEIERVLIAGAHVPVSIAWSPVYEPDWNEAPERYLEAGEVRWGRSRRLARIVAPKCAFKSYFGVQAWEPARWNLPGDPEVKYFLSLFSSGRTLALRTYPTGQDALAALATALAQL